MGSLITPLTVTRTFLGPARSRCSQSQTPCKQDYCGGDSDGNGTFLGFSVCGNLPTPISLLRTSWYEFSSKAIVFSSNLIQKWWVEKNRGLLNAHLPSSKGDSAITDGQGEVRPKKTSLWPEMVFSFIKKSSLMITLAWAGMSSGPSQECLNGICSGTSLWEM